MSNYAITCYGAPQFQNPEDEGKPMERFMGWLGGLGDAVVDPGTPLGEPKTISATGVSEGGRPDRLMGFTIVKADSMDAAVEMAKQCPFLDFGTLDVAAVMQMGM